MATLRTTAEYDKFDDPGFEPLPDQGKDGYLAIIRASSVKPAKNDPASEVVTLVADILEPEKYNKRKHFCRFNTKNKNAQAQNIGLSQFKAFKAAVGVMSPRDTIELHNIPFRMHLKVKENDRDEMQNELKYPFFGPKNKGATPAQQAVAHAETAPWIKAAGSDGATATGGVPGIDPSVPF